MKFDNKETALVVVDPQNEFLHEMGEGYKLAKDVIEANNTIENMVSLLKVAKENGYKIFVSPHYYYPHDYTWKFGSNGEHMMHNMKMFERKGPSEAVEKDSRADILNE